MALLFLVRLGTMAAYPEAFESLSAIGRVHAFARGVRFDASITLALFGLPVLLLLLPVRARAWRLTWQWAGFVLLVALAVISIGNAIYFGQVGRHAGPEAAALPGELLALAGMALAEYRGPLVLFLAGVAAVGWTWKRLLDGEVRPSARPALAWFLAAAFVPVSVVVIRGGFQGKPMGAADVFDGVPRPLGLLALPGAYSILHGFVSTEAVPTRFMAAGDASTLAQAALGSPRERFLDPDYPLLRYREEAARSGAKPNVVVLLLEGWHPGAIDVYRTAQGLPPLGSTPTFDGLAREGLLFTDFYANGQRSAESFSALLAGIPALPGVRYIGLGMEQNRLAYVGHLAKENGYRSTFFVRGAHRDSFRLDSIAHLAGFDRYLGYEDIDAHDGLGKDHPWGASDERTFRRALDEIGRSEEPFLGFVFTLSTHRPWSSPGEALHLVPHDTDEHRYLNTVHYADHQLGRFLDAARTSDWYARTIFVLVSDHYPPLAERAAIDLPGRHRVPLLIVAPGLGPGVRDDPGSHVDLLPTIMDLAGWSGAHASLGHSLFEDHPGTAGTGPLVTGDLVTWIEGPHLVTHDLHRRTDASGDPHAVAAMESRLLGILQVTLEALRTNRVSRDAPR